MYLGLCQTMCTYEVCAFESKGWWNLPMVNKSFSMELFQCSDETSEKNKILICWLFFPFMFPAMRLPEIFGLSTFPVFWRPKIVWKFSEFSNVQNFRETYRKYYQKNRNQPKYVKNVENNQDFWKFWFKTQKFWKSVWQTDSKCIHAKIALKTVLACIEAEIINFLCLGHFWSDLDSI